MLLLFRGGMGGVIAEGRREAILNVSSTNVTDAHFTARSIHAVAPYLHPYHKYRGRMAVPLQGNLRGVGQGSKLQRDFLRHETCHKANNLTSRF